MTDGRARKAPSLAASLVLAAVLGFASPSAGGPPMASGPPFDADSPTPHSIRIDVDTSLARDFLTVLAAGPGAPDALRRLEASRPVAVAYGKTQSGPVELLGRLASAAAGHPDPLMKGIRDEVKPLSTILDGLEADGPSGGALEARRLASLLPAEPKASARFVLVPVFALSAFSDVSCLPDGGTTWCLVDVIRLMGDQPANVAAREVALKALRATTAQAWRQLFDQGIGTLPGWSDPWGEQAPFARLLARTVGEGPSTLFLLPDEFFPLSVVLEEPIGRAFLRWNEVAELLLDPKVKDVRKGAILLEAEGGADFWGRYAAVVGGKIVDAVLRGAGRDAFTTALAEGPRAVLAIYARLSNDKAARLPRLGKSVRRVLSEPAAAAPR